MNRNDLVLARGGAVVTLGADLRWEVLVNDGTTPPDVIGAAWATDPWTETATRAADDGWRVLLSSKHPLRTAEGAPADAEL